MRITTRSHPDGIQITGIKALAGVLRHRASCEPLPDIYWQIIAPREGGELHIYEHTGAASYVPAGPDEVSIRYDRPRTMQGIAHDLRAALDREDIIERAVAAGGIESDVRAELEYTDLMDE